MVATKINPNQKATRVKHSQKINQQANETQPAPKKRGRKPKNIASEAKKELDEKEIKKEDLKLKVKSLEKNDKKKHSLDERNQIVGLNIKTIRREFDIDAENIDEQLDLPIGYTESAEDGKDEFLSIKYLMDVSSLYGYKPSTLLPESNHQNYPKRAGRKPDPKSYLKRFVEDAISASGLSRKSVLLALHPNIETAENIVSEPYRMTPAMYMSFCDMLSISAKAGLSSSDSDAEFKGKDKPVLFGENVTYDTLRAFESKFTKSKSYMKSIVKNASTVTKSEMKKQGVSAVKLSKQTAPGRTIGLINEVNLSLIQMLETCAVLNMDIYKMIGMDDGSYQARAITFKDLGMKYAGDKEGEIEFFKRLANRIEKLRIKNNLTVRELIDKQAIVLTTMNRMKSGATTPSSYAVDRALKLCDIFNVSIYELCGIENPVNTIRV